jgi:hypothetical protein
MDSIHRDYLLVVFHGIIIIFDVFQKQRNQSLSTKGIPAVFPHQHVVVVSGLYSDVSFKKVPYATPIS